MISWTVITLMWTKPYCCSRVGPRLDRTVINGIPPNDLMYKLPCLP